MSESHPRLRQRIISSILGVLILVGAFYYSGILKGSKKAPVQNNQRKVTSVIYAPVVLKNSAVAVQSNGTLTAKNKIDIVSRTQGVFKGGDRSF